MTVHAIWTNGQVVIDEPVQWPEGCELEIRPSTECCPVDDESEANDPAAIARWIAEFDAIPTFEMTPEEEAEWQAARRAQREFELQTFEHRAQKIQESLS